MPKARSISAGPLVPSGESVRLQTIERTSLRSAAVARIRQAIERGELRPGERLTELGLAKKLGVAQGTVREALVELEQQGFVQRQGPRMTRVTLLTPADVQDIYVVRQTLESLAAELLAQADDPDLSECEQAFTAMRRSAKAGDLDEFYAADLAFHRTLWTATGNASLVDSLDRLVPRLFAFGLIRHIAPGRQKLIATAERHGDLLAAVRAHDAEAAKRLMAASMEEASVDDAELSIRNSRPAKK